MMRSTSIAEQSVGPLVRGTYIPNKASDVKTGRFELLTWLGSQVVLILTITESYMLPCLLIPGLIFYLPNISLVRKLLKVERAVDIIQQVQATLSSGDFSPYSGPLVDTWQKPCRL